MTVTNINNRTSSRTANAPTVSRAEQALLDQIAQRSSETASSLLAQLFSSTDDLFYELSERASTNNEENLYFEAMRAIRSSKDYFSREFVSRFIESFQKIPSLTIPSHTRAHDDQELAIVDRNQLEIELAQKSMADRARDSYKQELHDLEARLDHMLRSCSLKPQNNPLDPGHLAYNFVSLSGEVLNLDMKTRLIFFKLFEKHFLKQLGNLYFDANQLLINAGILPKVPRKAVKNEQTASSAIEEQKEQRIERRASGAAARVRPFHLQTNALASLMSSIRAAKLSNAPNAQGFGSYHVYSANPGALMLTPELTGYLTDNQHQFSEQFNADTPSNIVPSIIGEILSRKNPQRPQALEQPSEDIINLVALFFDKVLEDQNLPLAVQSLICRLQIPLLKIALHDGSFLTDDNHPARLLINSVTQIGLGFDSSRPVERDPLYKIIVSGIQTINQKFKLDNDVIREVLDNIEKAEKEESAKTDVVEGRTRQAEAGKAKLKAAKEYAQNTVYEKIRDVSLPPTVGEFLTGAWLQVLVITYVRKGKDCSDWVAFEQLISDLSWASQVHVDEKSRLRQQRLKPEILRTIAHGLELAVDNDEARSAKINEIATVLDAAQKDDNANSHYSKLSEEQKTKLGKADPEKKTWDEMTALERQQARYEELSSQFYIQAKNMPLATWLAYFDDNRDKTLRCKLSAKIDADNYIFVNRLGFKALVKTRRQFAYDMQFNKVKVLDTTPVFDRLMEKVVRQIRSLSRDM